MWVWCCRHHFDLSLRLDAEWNYHKSVSFRSSQNFIVVSSHRWFWMIAKRLSSRSFHWPETRSSCIWFELETRNWSCDCYRMDLCNWRGKGNVKRPILQNWSRKRRWTTEQMRWKRTKQKKRKHNETKESNLTSGSSCQNSGLATKFRALSADVIWRAYFDYCFSGHREPRFRMGQMESHKA
jgi:hypothetical protein